MATACQHWSVHILPYLCDHAMDGHTLPSVHTLPYLCHHGRPHLANTEVCMYCPTFATMDGHTLPTLKYAYTALPLPPWMATPCQHWSMHVLPYLCHHGWPHLANTEVCIYCPTFATMDGHSLHSLQQQVFMYSVHILLLLRKDQHLSSTHTNNFASTKLTPNHTVKLFTLCFCKNKYRLKNIYIKIPNFHDSNTTQDI